MNSTDEQSNRSDSDVAMVTAGKRRCSAPSRSCVGWHVDTGSLSASSLQCVGVALLDDSSGLPTPPNSQQQTPLSPDRSMRLCETVLDPYCTKLEDFVPGDFLSYKRRKLYREETVDPFCRLSNELLLRLFSLLPRQSLARCARVCRRWRHLASDESLWRRCDCSSRSMAAGTLGRLLQRRVRLLRLARTEILSPVFCDPVSLQSEPVVESRLTHLDLSMATISAQGLQELLTSCRDLVKLSLERCDLTTSSCASIGRNSRLRALNCALTTGISLEGMLSLLRGCQQLEELNLGWTGLECDTLDVLVAHVPSSLIKLNISGCRDQLLDSHVLKLGRNVGPVLRVLDLSDASEIGAASLEAILEHMANLQELSLSRCYSLPIGLSTFREMSKLNSLVYLDMFGCFSQKGLDVLKRHLPAVQINSRPLSTVARPTVGVRRTSIWQLSVSQP